MFIYLYIPCIPLFVGIYLVSAWLRYICFTNRSSAIKRVADALARAVFTIYRPKICNKPNMLAFKLSRRLRAVG